MKRAKMVAVGVVLAITACCSLALLAQEQQRRGLESVDTPGLLGWDPTLLISDRVVELGRDDIRLVIHEQDTREVVGVLMVRVDGEWLRFRVAPAVGRAR